MPASSWTSLPISHWAGSPARSLVERSGLSQTPFVTHAADRQHGTWDKIFCNLDDFGRSFAAGRRAVPNPIRPDRRTNSPDALLEALDVALTLRSAGAHDFDREGESLSTVDEVDLVYRHPAAAGVPLSADTRFGEELRQAFSASQIEAKSAELSITHPAEMLPMAYVSMVCVEPIEFEGVELVDVVSGLLAEFETELTVRTRRIGERKVVWDDLVRLLANGPLPFAMVCNRADVRPTTREWLNAVRDRDLGWQFDRFASCLYDGTQRPMQVAASTHDFVSSAPMPSGSSSERTRR